MQSSSQDVYNATKNNNWLWHRKWKTKVTLSISEREREMCTQAHHEKLYPCHGHARWGCWEDPMMRLATETSHSKSGLGFSSSLLFFWNFAQAKLLQKDLIILQQQQPTMTTTNQTSTMVNQKPSFAQQISWHDAFPICQRHFLAWLLHL